MNPRLLLLAPTLLVVLIAACGGDDDDASSASTVAPPADATLPTVPAGGSYEYATGADDVVVEVTQEGGFVPPEVIFARTPTALISGDGRALSTGPTTMIFPGPLLPNLLQRSITPQGIQSVLAQADELGLLAEVEYPRNDQIADAPDTVVTITVGGTTYRHQAYALGFDTESDPARANLAEFVAAMTDLQTTVGAGQLGPEEPYAATTYLIQATPVDLDTMTFDVEPTVVPWPADATVSLADAAECAELPADEAEPVFADANQLTFFTESDVTYQVAAVQQVPGRTC